MLGADLKHFLAHPAVLQKLRAESSNPEASIEKFCSTSKGQSIATARKLATELHGGEPVLWDCDAAKTPEGLYRTTGGIEVSPLHSPAGVLVCPLHG